VKTHLDLLGDYAIKRVGDHAVVAPIAVEPPGEDDAPTTRMIFDVVDGRLECRDLQVTAKPGGREVRKSDLAAIAIDHARDQVMTTYSVPWETTEGGTTMRPAGYRPDDPRAGAALRSLDRARRRLTDDDLRRIADIYQQDTTGAPTRAVAEAFRVAHRTGTLYVQRARMAGLLPPVAKPKGSS
jgi:hypothetical protein